MRRGGSSRLNLVLLYLLILAAALLAAEGLLHRRYLRATSVPLPKRPFAKTVRHVPQRTLLRLGWLDADKESSFVRFERTKRPGVVRVGCLGDSFTYGAEVGPAEDYPSLLQRLFRERGYPQVEVLNFGSGWFGFQQSFILWEDVARHFGLDYVLLGPGTFFFGRDTTFDHSFPFTIHFLHARYALDGPGVRLWEVVGETFEERSAAYRRLIPRWRYLRYDRRAPAFLACLLPRGRELRNPFYYRRDIKGELDEVYRRLLLRMEAGGAQVVLGSPRPDIVELGRVLGQDGLYPVDLEEVRLPPYRAPKNHGSPAGNRLVAEQFFAVLTGRTRAALPLIRFRPLQKPGQPAARAPARNLDAYGEVTVGCEDGEPWRFVEIGRGMNIRDLPPDALRRAGVRSLLALKTPGQPLSEAVFYPLGADLEEGMPLVLESAKGRAVLGRVSLLRPDLQVGVVDLGEFLAAAKPGVNEMDAVFRVLPRGRGLLPGRVVLDGGVLFEALKPDRSGQVALRPRLRRLLRIYAPPEPLGAGAGRRSGLLSLRLTSRGRSSVSVPLAAWERAERGLSVAFPGPGIPRPIRRPGR